MLRTYMEQLSRLPHKAIVEIAFLRDSSRQRLSAEERASLFQGADDYGVATARAVRASCGDLTVEGLIAHHGITLEKLYRDPETEYALFAYFQPPSTIAVNTLVTERCGQLAHQMGLEPLMGGADIQDIILAHELYHYLETLDGAAYPQQKHYTQRVLGLPLRRRIAALEEVAAMAFAREYLNLPLSPFLYNVMMLEPFHPKQARALFLAYTQQKEV